MFRSAFVCGFLVLSGAAQAQAPSPAQMGITATTPQTLEVLDNTKTWVLLGTVSGGVFSAKGSAVVDPRDYGAKCDGTTDDSAALNAAAAAAQSAGKALSIPNAVCYSASALNFGMIAIVGAAPIVPTVPTAFAGPTISCAAAIAAPCLTVGTLVTDTDLGATIQNLVVGFTGTPIAGDAAFKIQGFNSVLDKTLASNAWDGYWFAKGLAAHATWLNTRTIYNNHIVQDGFPEVYLVNVRFGTNGGDTVSSNAYFGITGSDPNTLTCVACQVNTGGQAPKYVYDFYNITSQANGVYRLDDSIIDLGNKPNLVAIIHSDGTGTCFRCLWDGVTIVGAVSKPFFALGSAPPMNQAAFTNSNFFVGSFTVPATTYVGLRLANLYVSGTVTLDGVNGQATVSGVLSAGAMTVQGSWSYLSLNGVLGAPYSDTVATGNIYASNTPRVSWTPQLQFGGANVGLTQTSSFGYAVRQSDGTVKQAFGVGLSAVGTSTGLAAIAGTPYTCNNFGLGQIDMGPIYAVGMSGLTSATFAAAKVGANGIALTYNGAGGLANLQNTNFTNTSSIAGTTICTPN